LDQWRQILFGSKSAELFILCHTKSLDKNPLVIPVIKFVASYHCIKYLL
jgi:hypothetical protein